MVDSKNKILFPNIDRNPEDEFPKQCVAEFLISAVKQLEDRYGDRNLFVSHSVDTFYFSPMNLQLKFNVQTNMKRV